MLKRPEDSPFVKLPCRKDTTSTANVVLEAWVCQVARQRKARILIILAISCSIEAKKTEVPST